MERGTVTYGSKGCFWGKTKANVAFANFSIAIGHGECVGLVGPSGCGKSTVGRCLARLQKLSCGDVLLSGESVWKISPLKCHGAVQMIFQSPYDSLDPRQTVHSAIDEPLKIHFKFMNAASRRKTIGKLMGAVRLDESLLWRKPSQLSGGQRQRVAVARSLAVEPKFLICDEVVSALDYDARDGIIELLASLCEKNELAILLIGHDMEMVDRLCSRTVSMGNGQKG
jgi:ABC-type dipeptide/oligopeptide/nickel transport system ATPase subunit